MPWIRAMLYFWELIMSVPHGKWPFSRKNQKFETGRFWGATIFWTSPADSSSKISACHYFYFHFRPLALEIKVDFRKFAWLMAKNDLKVIFAMLAKIENLKQAVFEELRFFGRHWQIPRRKSLPVIYFFSHYDLWRRGKSGTHHFWSWFLAKNDFHICFPC